MGQRWEGYIGVRKDRSVWKRDQGIRVRMDGS